MTQHTEAQVKFALDLYDRHACTPQEIRYLMVYRKLPPDIRQQVNAFVDLLLRRGAEKAAPPRRHPDCVVAYCDGRCGKVGPCYVDLSARATHGDPEP